MYKNGQNLQVQKKCDLYSSKYSICYMIYFDYRMRKKGRMMVRMMMMPYLTGTSVCLSLLCQPI